MKCTDLANFTFLKEAIVSDISINGKDVIVKIYIKDNVQIQVVEETNQFRLLNNLGLFTDLKKFEDESS